MDPTIQPTLFNYSSSTQLLANSSWRILYLEAFNSVMRLLVTNKTIKFPFPLH